MNRCARSVLAIAAGALVVTACGDDDDSAGDAAQDLCRSMSELEATVAGVAGADLDLETTTVGDVRDGLEELQDQIDSVEEAREDVAESVVSSLVDAHSSYLDAIDDISDDSTLAEAGEQVTAARAAFDAAWNETLTELDCGPSTT